MECAVDDLWSAFSETLPERLRDTACTLPYCLGLAPAPTAHWSDVFSHGITLAAPAMVARALPDVTDDQLRKSTVAHLLAIVDAFGNDRIEDGQVADREDVRAVLERARQQRDVALSILGDADGYMRSDRTTLSAIREERTLLARCQPVSRKGYRLVSLGKQSPGFPASLALARACGWEQRRLRNLALMFVGVWLGLQCYDDAIDWEDDWSNGGAWAVCLARYNGIGVTPSPRPATLAEARRLVLARGALGALVGLSGRWFRLAGERARMLGVSEVAEWAGVRAQEMENLLELELAAPGFVVRKQRLAAWAAEVVQ